MKIKLDTIKQEIKNFLIKKIKQKRIKINTKVGFENIDLIKKNIIDSIDFLDLITHLEDIFKVDIDLSNVNANNFSKINSLSKSIFKNLK